MTPPKLFERYITPYYQKIAPQLHARGKLLAYHADDDSKAILRQVKDAGFDMAECFATAPLVTVTLREARQAWGSDVIIFGGVPSIILEEDVMTDAAFETYMQDVFRTIAPGDAFILGVADNVMPRSKIERVERITQLVDELGRYPVSAS
jgi:uroporphyrinogen-III decarboxylase